MNRKQRWLVSIGIIGFAILTACALPIPPPALVASQDHERLAEWYTEEAEHLRAHAEEVREMAKEYKYIQYSTTTGVARHEMVDQLAMIVDHYSHAAQEAEALAEAHRAMAEE